MKKRKNPLRKCIVCNERKEKKDDVLNSVTKQMIGREEKRRGGNYIQKTHTRFTSAFSSLTTKIIMICPEKEIEREREEEEDNGK